MTNALRPLTIGELLDRTFFLYRTHFGLFVGIAALPNLLLLAFQLSRLVIDPVSMGMTAGLIATFIWLVVMVLVYLVTIALSQGATVVAVSQIQLGRPTSVSEAFTAIMSRIGELAVVIFGMFVRLVIGFVLFIVPGIIWTIMWSLTIPVAVLERKNLRESLARSSALTQGHRGRIFLIYFLLLMLTYIVALVVQVPAILAVGLWSAGLPGGEMPALAQIILALANFLTTSLVAPILTIALSLVYYDERVRKEAFDLEVMMRQLDQAASPAT